MAVEVTEPIERWMTNRRVALVVSIVKSELSVAEAAQTHGLTSRGGGRLAGKVSAGRASESPEG
jgi:hypothetical protein